MLRLVATLFAFLAVDVEGLEHVAEWLQGSAADATGNGNTLDTTAGIVFSPDPFTGKEGLTYKGAGEYVIPSTMTDKMKLKSNTLLTLWVRPNGASTRNQAIFVFGTSSSGYSLGFYFVGGSTGIRVYEHVSGFVTLTQQDARADGTWVHLALYFDVTALSFRFEIDGALRGTFNYVKSDIDYLSIGCLHSNGASNSELDGTMMYGMSLYVGDYPCSSNEFFYDKKCHYFTSSTSDFNDKACQAGHSLISVHSIMDDLFYSRCGGKSAPTYWAGLTRTSVSAWEWKDSSLNTYNEKWCGDGNHPAAKWDQSGTDCEMTAKPSGMGQCSYYDYSEGPGLIDSACVGANKFHLCYYRIPNFPTPAPDTTAPDTVAPATTAPDTTAPDTVAPDTTAPDTVAPDTMAPDTVAPDTTAPDTAAPDTTAPDTTAPDTMAPNTTAPDTAAPDTVAPDTTAPDTTAPDTTAPDTMAPDTTAPDTMAPDTTAPATTAPDTMAPDTTAPDTMAPDTTAPDTTAPDTMAPDTTAPDTTAPDTMVPDTTAPDTTAPDTMVPDTTAPDTTAPDTMAPDTTAPDTTAPDTVAPDTTAPDTVAPDTTAPDTIAPDTQAPKTLAPATGAPDTLAPQTLTPGDTIAPPTVAPATLVPTAVPTVAPATLVPTAVPTVAPATLVPTAVPTVAPATEAPATQVPPTGVPTDAPQTPAPSTGTPTAIPTTSPTTSAPTAVPTQAPSTTVPTAVPTGAPNTVTPTVAPTQSPSTDEPTAQPTAAPTPAPGTFTPLTPAPSTTIPTEAPKEAFTSVPKSQNPTTAPLTLAPTAVPLPPTEAPGTYSPLTPKPQQTSEPTPTGTGPETSIPNEKEILRPTPAPGTTFPVNAKNAVKKSSSGAAAVGTNGGKLAAVIGMECEVEDIDLGGGEPLDWEFHPIGIGIGDHAQKYFLGAVVFNLGIMVVFFALNYAIAWAQVAWLGVPWETAIFYVRAPGLVYIPMVWLLMGTSIAASNLAFFPSRAPAWVALVGFIVLTLCISLPVVMWMTLLRRGKFKATTVPDAKINEDAAVIVNNFGKDGEDDNKQVIVYTGWKRTAYILVYGSEVWVRKDGAPDYFVEQYGLFFEQYRHSFHWFSIVEMVQMLALALTSAWKPHNHGMCMFRNVLITLVLFFFFLAIVTLRPYNSTLDMITATAMSGLMFVAVLLMAIAIGVGGSEVMMKWAAYLLFLTALIMMFKGVYDLILYALDVKIGRRWDAVRAARAGNVDVWKGRKEAPSKEMDLEISPYSPIEVYDSKPSDGEEDVDLFVETFHTARASANDSQLDMIKPLLDLLNKPLDDTSKSFGGRASPAQSKPGNKAMTRSRTFSGRKQGETLLFSI